MKTFVHRFSPKLSCTYEVPDSGWGQKIIRAKPHIVWHGEPKPKNWSEYVSWINEVNEQLANEWNQRLMHCFKHGGELEVWCYEPGKPPRKATNLEHEAAGTIL